jgi:hypothetical protein
VMGPIFSWSLHRVDVAHFFLFRVVMGSIFILVFVQCRWPNFPVQSVSGPILFLVSAQCRCCPFFSVFRVVMGPIFPPFTVSMCPISFSFQNSQCLSVFLSAVHKLGFIKQTAWLNVGRISCLIQPFCLCMF